MDRTTKEEIIFGYILLLANKLQIWGDHILSDLTLKQWFLLILISKMNIEKPTVKEISEFSGTSRQNVKKLLETLEKKDYVCINKSNADARALNVHLTEKTFKLFNDNEQKGADSINLLFSTVSDKGLEITYQTMQKLLDYVENLGGKACGN